jgi:hypothetical protein
MNIEKIVEPPKTHLAKIKLKCLSRFYQHIKDNGYELPGPADMAQLVMHYSHDLPELRDFAELGAWMKQRYLMIQNVIQMKMLKIEDIVDEGLVDGARLLSLSNKKKQSFFSSIFSGGDDYFK